MTPARAMGAPEPREPCPGDAPTHVVVLCDSAALRRAVFAFRYRVYVEQMGRRQRHADHLRRLLEEPMDADARNYALLRGEEVVATIRANEAEDPAARYYRKLYRLDALGLASLAAVQVTTKLMLRPELRGSLALARLLLHFGAESCRLGMQLDVMDCNAPLIPMFERFGYHSYCGWVFHKEFGTVRAMLCPADTGGYLAAIGSPLARALGSRVADDAFGGYGLLRRIAELPATPALHAAFAQHVRPL
jgi:hypothetical protein